MTEPRIQYAKTADWVSIAFWTLGEGMPLVHMPLIFSHIQMEWQIQECRRWYECLGQHRRLIRYDVRTTGLSDRGGAETSPDALMLDIDAVADRLGLARFALMGLSTLAPVAIAYAARHPERVSHLILWGAYARASQYSETAGIQALRALMDKDWTFYTEAAAHSLLGWSEGEPARRYAALIRESITQEDLKRAIATINQFDVEDLLPQVKAPALVIQRRRAERGFVEAARRLSSRIPDAHLVLLEGESGAPYLGDTEAVLAAIDEFLGESERAAVRVLPREDVHTILFTDIERSTTLTQRLGDAKAQEVLRTHNTIVRGALKARGGTEVKHTGDGIMASFPSASQALQCAIIIQQAVTAHTATPFRVRIGLNAGEPVAEEQDLFGTAVQLARRVCDHADPGQILVSDLVAGLAAGKGFAFEDKGEASLKGFDRPVRLYEVRWQEEASGRGSSPGSF